MLLPGNIETAPAGIFFPGLSASWMEKKSYVAICWPSFFFLYVCTHLIFTSLSILPAVWAVLLMLSFSTFFSSDTGGFGASEKRSPWVTERNTAQIKFWLQPRVYIKWKWTEYERALKITLLNIPHHRRRTALSLHWRGHFSLRTGRSRRHPSLVA